MTIFSTVHKPHKFESLNSLKLSFTNIRCLRYSFHRCKFFLEKYSPDILAWCGTNLNDSIGSSNFSVRSYLPCAGIIFRENWGFLIVFSTGFTSFGFLFLFPLLITIFVFVLSFDTISSNIDEILSINPSASVFILEDFNLHHKHWLTYSCGTTRPGEFCYKFSIWNKLTPVVNILGSLPDCF